MKSRLSFHTTHYTLQYMSHGPPYTILLICNKAAQNSTSHPSVHAQGYMCVSPEGVEGVYLLRLGGAEACLLVAASPSPAAPPLAPTVFPPPPLEGTPADRLKLMIRTPLPPPLKSTLTWLKLCTQMQEWMDEPGCHQRYVGVGSP